jgi:zinc transport system substrate-binding protein
VNRAIWAAAAVIGASLLSACTGTGQAAPNAPVLEVVTGLYPLAQAAAQIGQTKVHVTDFVPAGADPRSYTLTPEQIGQVRQAGLVLDVGGGFQPSFEEAASGAPRVTRLEPYAWLDPPAMKRAVAAIATAMEAADPPAARLFEDGATAFTAEVASDGIDYQSTLSTCSRTTMFTPDEAFQAMANDMGLKDVVVGTTPLEAARGAWFADRVEHVGGRIFSETWVSDDAVREVASGAHTKVSALDTLLGAPAGGWPDSRYIDLLESNLGVLSSALGCESS